MCRIWDQLKEDKLTGFPKRPATDEGPDCQRKQKLKKVSHVVSCPSKPLPTVEQSKDGTMSDASTLPSCPRKKAKAKRSDPVLRSKITWWFGKTSGFPGKESTPKSSADHLSTDPIPCQAVPTIAHEASSPTMSKKRRRGRKPENKKATPPTISATPEASLSSRRDLEGCSPILQSRNASRIPKKPKKNSLLLPPGMKQKGIQTKAVKGATTSLELAADRKRKPDNVLTTKEAGREASTLHNEADEEGSKFIV